MNNILSILVERLDSEDLVDADVIRWGSPVLSFGDLAASNVATLGLNPSNKEFVDNDNRELVGEFRRFHTLSSLGLERWCDADDSHLEMIMDSCRNYFSRNPYDSWFKSLDGLLAGTKSSYYCSMFKACHLDLVPYATRIKWADLSTYKKNSLLSSAADFLGYILRDSNIEILILNGQTVVNTLEHISNFEYKTKRYQDWILPRKRGDNVKGFGYSGNLSNIAGVEIGRQIRVLGFNHNIQSSFGVTNKVKSSIGAWIGEQAMECVN